MSNLNHTRGAWAGMGGARGASERTTQFNQRQAEFLAALKRTKDIQAACDECGISRATPSRWKGRNPVFGVEMELAMESP